MLANHGSRSVVRRLVASLLFFVMLAACSNSQMEEEQEEIPLEEPQEEPEGPEEEEIQEPEEEQEEEPEKPQEEPEEPVEEIEPPAPDTIVLPVIKVDSLREGMMRVVTRGAPVWLSGGRMRVDLDYDYSLGIHEVTCAEFEDVARKEDWYFYLDCSQDDLPVTNVTYYDAVLFANAYGKAHGYDTVYTYHRRFSNSKGHCVNLEGLELRTGVDGFRLPTEAEWVLAAVQSWSPDKYSWNFSNSNFVLHPPCAFPDSVGFCDMAGNALELMNDWLGPQKETIVKNYIGPPTGNSLFEKVVKGGSMIQQMYDINLVNRGDVYPVTASSISTYIGFRLAFGKIPGGIWMDGHGDVATSTVKMKAFSSELRDKMGTMHVKLAFRNDQTGNLAYVDFSGVASGVVELVDTIPVFHPDISPDGRKVAFCTGMEGIAGQSSVYVRNLDASGSGLVKLDVKNAAIPRWHVGVGGDTSIVYVDYTGNNTDDAEFFAGATWMVPFSNGTFGTPRKLMDGAYHGGLSRDESFAVTGARRLRAHVDGIDKIWYKGEQACNASLSKDGRNQTLFLDFGGETGRNFANENYGVHERLLVADSNGKLVRAIPAPGGYSFDHSEWVDRRNWAVVSLVNIQGVHAKLALVNVLDSSVMDLVEGEELWHPNLWVMSTNAFEKENLVLDSAGLYWDPIYQGGEKAASLKMRMFWDMHDSLQVIAVGSSRTERGFDPAQVSKPALNFGYIGGDLWAALYLMDNYIVPHANKLKYLVVEISFDLMCNSKSTRMQYAFEQAPGYFYDRNHNFWRDGLPDGFVRLVDANVCYTDEDSLKYVSTRGLLKIDSYGWRDEPEIKRDTVMSVGRQQVFSNSVDSLTAFIDSTQNKGFKIIGLVYPQSPAYANTGSFGRHGIRRSLAMETVAYFDSLASVYPHFIMMDENKFGAHDYTDDMANDYDHLAAAGAEHLSVRLDSLIRALEQ